MYQDHLFNRTTSIVNVASVPQRSPFRYAGGKTWLIPRIRRWLDPFIREKLGLYPIEVTDFFEPFAGGGSISLTVAAEKLANHVTMVEIDEDVAAVWQTILDPKGSEWLAQRILSFDMNYEAVLQVLSEIPSTTEARAFMTIIKNRTFHGGIMAPGAGLLKHGENGRGVRSRWYPETLARRIRDITQIRDRITFIHGNGIEVLSRIAHRHDTACFIDPPYTVTGTKKKAGSRLYRYNEIDHEQLFSLASNIQGDYLFTYDVTDAVYNLAQSHTLQCRAVSMKNTHHATMDELLISPNMSWLDEVPITSTIAAH